MKSSLKRSLFPTLVALLLAGQADAAEHFISMESYGFFNFRFSPNYLEIEVGDTVTFVNNDYTQFGYGGYDADIYVDSYWVGNTDLVLPGERSSLIFPYAATFTIVDHYYEEYGMTGTIVAREPQGTAQPPVFVNPQWLESGRFSCTVSNLVIGTTNLIFAADSPGADAGGWSLIRSNIVMSTEEVFVDTPLGQRRFYRAARP